MLGDGLGGSLLCFWLHGAVEEVEGTSDLVA